MRKAALLLSLPLVVPLLAGCLQVDTVLHVKKDGSGTLEEKVVMSSVFVEQMRAMAEQMKAMGGEMPGGDFSTVDEERLRTRAASMGEGVSFLKAEPVKTDRGEGYRAVFSFNDIRTLRVNQNPSDVVPAGPGEGEPASEFITFGFTPGSTATLTLTMPEEPEEEGGEVALAEEEEMLSGGDEYEEGGEDAAAMEEQMKEMFRDLRISMAVEVDGEIVDTNATNREGSRVTLMEMDFGKLLENPEKFQALQSDEARSLEEAKELMKDLPGIKVELNQEVKITFR